MIKEKSPTGGGTPEGRTSKKNHRGNFTTIPVAVKRFVVELASRGFIPPTLAAFILRVLHLKEA